MVVKFLADMGISMKTVEWLRQSGHDTVHLVEEGLYRLPDKDILIKATRENRVVLTMDLDFGYLLAISKKSLPSVVIFRLSDERAETINRRLDTLLSKHIDDLLSGVVVSVGDKTIRLRKLPFKSMD